MNLDERLQSGVHGRRWRLGAAAVFSLLAAAGLVAWRPWQTASERFCEALRNPPPAAEQDPLSLYRTFAQFAPAEIRADAKYVYEFHRAMLTGRFPGASGPGVAILSMNPQLQEAEARVGAFVSAECRIASPAAPEAEH